MGTTYTFLTSSLGRKIVMALTGFFLFSFLVLHLYINLFTLKADAGATFDEYAEFMATYPLLRPLEIVLFAGFLLHAVVGVWLWLGNRSVRSKRYKVIEAPEQSPVSSRVAFWTGMVVLAFLIVHVNTFFVQSRFFPDGRTMYEYVMEAFSSPGYVVFYLVALAFLAYHLKHGFQSACQTLGLRTPRYQRTVDVIGVFFWLIIPIGFALIPLYFLFRN
jgi:succinate dehydrogenase / fumarate reductase cytochrome b subunit